MGMAIAVGRGMNLKLLWLSMGYETIFASATLHLLGEAFPCWKHFGCCLTAATGMLTSMSPASLCHCSTAVQLSCSFAGGIQQCSITSADVQVSA